MISFQDKTLLITGGTGSFGNAVLDRFLTTDIREIRILSRDEKKQDDMRSSAEDQSQRMLNALEPGTANTSLSERKIS